MTDVGDDAAVQGASVRPIDLDPARTGAVDVLAGWDVDGAVPARLERPPFPHDTVAVGAAALVGALVAGAASGGRRGGRAVLGAVLGVTVVGAARRVWRSP